MSKKDLIDMTLEDFAKWILELPETYREKKIWFIDIVRPFKGKALDVEESPSKEFISITDSTDPT